MSGRGKGRGQDAERSAGARRAEAQRLLDLLHALGGTVFRPLLWQKASELDLTFAQSEALFYVAENPGCRMGDVAKAFGVTLPAVTHVVDRLEEKRFLVRGHDPADGRVHVLDVTAEGAALARELQMIRLAGLEAVVRRMSRSDRERVLGGLEALVEAAAGTPDEAPGRRTGRARERDHAP